MINVYSGVKINVRGGEGEGEKERERERERERSVINMHPDLKAILQTIQSLLTNSSHSFSRSSQ